MRVTEVSESGRLKLRTGPLYLLLPKILLALSAEPSANNSSSAKVLWLPGVVKDTRSRSRSPAFRRAVHFNKCRQSVDSCRVSPFCRPDELLTHFCTLPRRETNLKRLRSALSPASRVLLGHLALPLDKTRNRQMTRPPFADGLSTHNGPTFSGRPGTGHACDSQGPFRRAGRLQRVVMPRDHGTSRRPSNHDLNESETQISESKVGGEKPSNS